MLWFSGPEAADGRPSPEPRDGLHHMLVETNILRVHTDSHNSTAESHGRAIEWSVVLLPLC